MQKKKRKIRRICCLFLIVFGIFLQQSPCDIYASEQKEELAIKLNHFKLGEDAKEEFSPEISYNKEEGNMKISFQTMNQKEGEYPVSVFENTKQKLSGYAGVNIKVKNSAENVKGNVLFSTQKGNVLVLEDDVPVILKQNGTCYTEKVEYGAFSIPANFEGEIYIPFSSFTKGDEAEREELEKGIYGLGFTLVAPEKKQISVEFQSVSFIPKTENEIFYFTLSGSEKVLRPSIGESVENYSVDFFDREGQKIEKTCAISYCITKDGRPAKGISMDENGKLTVTAEAQEGEYRLEAKNSEGESTYLLITLKKSWTETQKTENGYDASMVLPDEVVKVVDDTSVWMNAGYLVTGRVLAVVSVVAFFIYYIYKHKKNKEAFRKEFFGEEE